MTFELDEVRSFDRPDADGNTWYRVYGRTDTATGEPYAVAVDVDGHPTIWRGEYPLGTGLEAVTLYRAFAQYLFNLDDHRGSRA